MLESRGFQIYLLEDVYDVRIPDGIGAVYELDFVGEIGNADDAGTREDKHQSNDYQRVRQKIESHINPVMKIAVTPIFLFCPIWSLHIIGIGKKNM